jgi:hypothetical protein
VATRELRTAQEPVVCEICRRSLLRGEYPVSFYDGRTLRDVCDLCTVRAQRQGWIRDGVGADTTPAAHAARARSLVGRLRSRTPDEQSASLDEPVADQRSVGEPPQQAESLRQDVYAEHDDSSNHDERAQPGAPPQHDEQQQVQAATRDRQAMAARALALFNATDYARTVAGVIRSLGAPYVYAGLRDDHRAVQVLVVWELCWYRYEIDLESSVVHLQGQGYEPAELGTDLPAANAIADERGKLALASY